MMTTDQSIQRIIDQEIYCNASTFVADLSAANVVEVLPNTYDNLIACCIKDDYQEPVTEALRDITPSGLFDFCETFGFELYAKRDDVPLTEDEAETMDHDTVDRERLIAFLEEGPTDWQELANHLDVEPVTHEALQHWLVSDWFAEQLEEVGALVATDVMGFNVWGRTECGQSLTMDSDIRRVVELVERRLAEM